MVGKRVKRDFNLLLSLDEPSERLALAFALGVFLTLTPFVGLHTLLAVAVAFLFGLNRGAVLFGLVVNNPWTLVPYYTAAAQVGRRLIGFTGSLELPEFGWSRLLSGGFWTQLAHQWRCMLPMALGSIILAALCAGLSYPLALYAIKKGRAALCRQSAP